MKPFAFATLVLLFLSASIARAQTGDSSVLSRRNTFTVFAEYSNDSSHILMGVSENRKLAAFGGSYARRLWPSISETCGTSWRSRPVLMESDPVLQTTYIVTPINPADRHRHPHRSANPTSSCKPGSSQQTIPISNAVLLCDGDDNL